MSFPLIRVVWRDHFTTGGWKDVSDLEAQEPDLNESVGWLVTENDERLTIVQTTGLDEEQNRKVRDSLTIEKSCIMGRERLA